MRDGENLRPQPGTPVASGGASTTGHVAICAQDATLVLCPRAATPAGLRRILYVSSASPWMVDDSDWQALLPAWRRRNLRDEITGALLHDQGSLMQLLEGPADHVTRLFDSIRHDPRHGGLVVLVDESAAHRLMPGRALAAARRGGDLVLMVQRSASTAAGEQASAAARAEVQPATVPTTTDEGVWGAIQSFGSVR